MQIFVTKEFSFDSAHFLTNYYGKCEKLHGHTYKLHVTVTGPVAENGLVLDFVILKKIVQEKVLSKLDHSLLNDIFPNPSSEIIGQWIWEQLSDLNALLQAELDNPNLKHLLSPYLEENNSGNNSLIVPNKINLELYEIKLWETPTSFVTIRN